MVSIDRRTSGSISLSCIGFACTDKKVDNMFCRHPFILKGAPRMSWTIVTNTLTFATHAQTLIMMMAFPITSTNVPSQGTMVTVIT